MTDKVVAVVQARMGSRRLPNKMMLWLNGYPVIEWVRRRLERCTKLDDIVCIVPAMDPANKPLVAYLNRKGIETYCHIGENNVLRRMFYAARDEDATYVVRVCGDCPLVSWEAVDALVETFMNNEVHYAYNNVPKGNLWPDGLGAEVVKLSTLKWLEDKVLLPSHREHVFTYIWDHLQTFRTTTFNPSDKRLHHPELKLDLDTYEDYQRMLASGVDIDMTAAEIVECFL